MIVLSNCLTDTADEGTRKVATSLVKRLRQRDSNLTVITYDCRCSLETDHISANKFLLNKKLLAMLRRKKEPVLYLPSPAKTLPMAIRLWILSRAAKNGLTVLITMPFPVSGIGKWLIKASKVRILTLSQSAKSQYSQAMGKSVGRLNVGVDTSRFCPVSREKKMALREKYAIPPDKPVALHIGHLNRGRNVQQMLKLDDSFHGVLVVSTQTAHQQDAELRKMLLQKANLTLIDRFIPQVEELYQLSDVYLFPVQQTESCIDSPLSALEAAACGVPVVATAFGELKSLINADGFYEIDSFEPEKLNRLLHQAIQEKKNPRPIVLPYDWENAVDTLQNKRSDKNDPNV